MTLDEHSSHSVIHTRRTTAGSAEQKHSRSKLEPGDESSVTGTRELPRSGQGKWLLHAYYI